MLISLVMGESFYEFGQVREEAAVIIAIGSPPALSFDFEALALSLLKSFSAHVFNIRLSP